MNKLYLLFLLCLILFQQGFSQSTKKLSRLYKKKKYERLINISDKSISKGKDNADIWYFKTRSHLKQYQFAINNKEEELKRAMDCFKTYNSTYSDPKKNILRNEMQFGIRSWVKKIKSDSVKTEYYIIYLAENCSDTLEDYWIITNTINVNNYSDSVNTDEFEFKLMKIEGIRCELPYPSPPGSWIIRQSEKAMNTPWRMGGMTPGKGFDCSGFVIWSYSKYGYKLPHKTKLLAKIGTLISLEEAQEGDIVCFGSKDYIPERTYHVGMIHSRNKDHVRMIHCGTSKGVSVVNLTEGYWSGKDYFIVRIPQVEK